MPQFLNFGPPSRSSSPSRDFLANLGVVLGLSQGMQLPIGIKLTPADSKYTEVSRGRWPGRGLLYSFVAHEVAIFALLVIPSKFLPSERRFREVERWLPLDAKLTYSLPEIGGGHEGGGRPGGKPGGGSPRKGGPAPAPAPRAGGLVYPGPQPIVSNPPNPTNRIQTILQPDLVKAPELKVPLPLPNMVMLARGPRAPAPPPLVPKVNPIQVRTPEAPKLQSDLKSPRLTYTLPLPPMPAPAEPPKLALPPPTPEPKAAASYEPKVPQVSPELLKANPAVPAAPNLAMPAGAGGDDERSILVLSPTPGLPEMAANIPAGEAHGQFAMGPEPNLTARSGIGPGGGSGTTTGGAASGTGSGTGTGGTGVGSGSGPGEGGGGGGGTGGGTGSGTGSGVGPGAGTGAGGSGTGSGVGINGTGGGGTGPGTGTGAGSGPGRGHGTGEGSGTGSGAGSGPGSGPFPGISIMGGSGTSGVSSQHGSRSRVPPSPPRGTYGMTVVATAASGGGLRDYGIFHNESVFTVYVDMTHSPEAAPSWTLQYALRRRRGADLDDHPWPLGPDERPDRAAFPHQQGRSTVPGRGCGQEPLAARRGLRGDQRRRQSREPAHHPESQPAAQ